MARQHNNKPMAICLPNGMQCNQQNTKHGNSKQANPIEVFTNTNVVDNPKHWKPFGCPLYVLNDDLKARRPF
jgi:hypothetical protein